MSRHRNLRNIDLDEERHDFDDYGHSYEDNYSISPSAEEFIYQRNQPRKDTKLHDFIEEEASSAHNTYDDDDHDQPIEMKIPPAQHHDEPLSRPESRDDADAKNGAARAFSPPSRVVKIGGSKVTTGFRPNQSSPMLSNLVVDRLKISDPNATLVSNATSSSRNQSPLKHVPSAAKLGQLVSTPRLKARPLNVKPVLNLVVVGHVDAGKSTLMGHFLYLMGQVNQKTMHKYKQDSQKIGKGSFAFAWVLDEGTEERARGVTIDVARARFVTQQFDVVLLDAPGHRDFIPNMISGAAQADAAILVVNATTGEFETGFDLGGQTREHTMLIRSLGVTQLIVAVNKLDTVDWSRQRFDDIVNKMRNFLKQTGYSKPEFVPCCGLTGVNLTRRNTTEQPCPLLYDWYKGPCLLEAIDNFAPPEQNVDSPLRFTISDIFRGVSSTTPLISGKVETGSIQYNDKVVIMPSSQAAIVKSVQTDESIDAAVAYAGDQCILALTSTDLANVSVGDVLCHPESPISVAQRFEARLVFFNMNRPVLSGSPVVIHCNSNHRSGFISKLVSQINSKTGEVIKLKPRCLSKHSSGLVEISTEKALCLELYSQNKILGRVTLRSEGVTIAAGVVTKLVKQTERSD